MRVSCVFSACAFAKKWLRDVTDTQGGSQWGCANSFLLLLRFSFPVNMWHNSPSNHTQSHATRNTHAATHTQPRKPHTQ